MPSDSFINPKGPAPQTDTLRKKSNDQSDTCDSNPETHLHRPDASLAGSDFVGDTLRPGRSILRGVGADAPKTWVQVLNMTLEEIYQGKTFHFRLIRYKLSGKRSIVPLNVTVPLGSRDGTQVIVTNVGNERKDGTRQDIVFLVKALKHKRFSRVHDDLLLEVRLPWVDSLNEQAGEVHVDGIDGKEYTFPLNFCKTGLLTGTTIIPNAGMPYRTGNGRGRIVVRFVFFSICLSSGNTRLSRKLL
jgi:DnaJ C terminal domain